VATRFFSDETDLGLARALEAEHPGLIVYPGHPGLPTVPRGTLDDDWLPQIGERRLVVITRDAKIRRRNVEKQLWLAHSVRGFVLTGRTSQSTAASLALLAQHWNRINALVERRPDGAWMFAVTSGQLREIAL
jgi:PIN like domain